MTGSDAAADSVRIERLMRAPPERVFRAFLEPELIRRWMTPGDLSIDSVTVEPRVGGRIRVEHSRNGVSTGHFEGEFLRIVPDRELVYRWAFVGTEPENGEFFDTLVTITLRPEPGGRTRLTVVHGELADLKGRAPEIYAQVEAEWGRSIDRISTSVEGTSA